MKPVRCSPIARHAGARAPAVLVAVLAAHGGCSGGDDGGGAPAAPDPYVLVPAEKLAADPAKDCPQSFASAAPLAGNNEGYEAAGQSRGFWLILPPATFAGPRPLFVAFNGTDEDGQEFSERAKLADFAARGFVVVAPSSNGNGTAWPVWDAMHTQSQPDKDNPDLAYFDSLVPCIAAHFSVDKHRIYIGGHSAGGIMTNYVLQRRSELLAGGIVASGVFSLTSLPEPQPLDPMIVLVTWGGDNDEYSGGTSEVKVPAINFVEQASIASVFYDKQAAVGQADCHGANQGHIWLEEKNTGMNGWMVDLLLAHPKGLAGSEGLTLPVPPSPKVSCTTEPFVFTGGLTVECPTTTKKPGCEKICQLYADCAAENATVGSILEPQLTKLGFSGKDNTDCSGCVPHCEAAATEPADAEVLSCMTKQAEEALCGPGIDGALPAIDAINVCCEGQKDSGLCVDVCTIMLENSATESFLPTCVALVGKPK
ncbi:MAG: prolyl oligopeptidase family serine peptidase [Deltaproteobacteria bacterium]|nr:prolyl oligopeptidase family serine peptidase [Deltaproteobacteria bacterium]